MQVGGKHLFHVVNRVVSPGPAAGWDGTWKPMALETVEMGPSLIGKLTEEAAA